MKVLYHSTPAENLQSIRENGIRRPKGHSIVFLSRMADSWRKRDDGQVTLPVDVDGLQGEFSEPIEGLDEIVYFGDIPSDRVGLPYNVFNR